MRVTARFGTAEVLLLLFLLSTSRVALAQVDEPAEQASTPGWDFSATLYSWLTAQQGHVTQGGRTVSVDVSLDDVFDLLGDGDAGGGAGHFEAYHRPSRVNLFLDVVGSVVDTDASTRIGTATLDSSLVFLEFGLGYRVWEAWFGEEEKRAMWLEGIAGGRYTYLFNEIGITLPGGSTQKTDSTIDFTDPFVGYRWRLELPHGFAFTNRGDIGGFDVGSELAWSMVATLTYDLPWTIAGAPLAVGAGYRILSFDYRQGSGGSKQVTDLEFRGPMLGVVAHF